MRKDGPAIKGNAGTREGVERLGSAAEVLILPGICNSGPTHWQTLWEAELPGCRRVRAPDWDRPVRADWVAALQAAIEPLDRAARVVLVAHSLGCLQVAYWALTHDRHIHGALLVAPPDPGAPAFPDTAMGFNPVPEGPLPFPSVLVASCNDPYATIDFSRRCAARWGSRLVEAGPHGHLNAASQLGGWPRGRAELDRLLQA